MKAQIVITLQDNMALEVNYPAGQGILCFGMLEIARQTIQRGLDEGQKLIMPASSMPNLKIES